MLVVFYFGKDVTFVEFIVCDPKYTILSINF